MWTYISAAKFPIYQSVYNETGDPDNIRILLSQELNRGFEVDLKKRRHSWPQSQQLWPLVVQSQRFLVIQSEGFLVVQ